MSDSTVSIPSAAARPAVKTRRYVVSLIWLVPVVAALIGLSMLISSSLEQGPVITISFQTAEGLEANKTQVKYKNVVIGQVIAITLAPDRSHVVATIELKATAQSFTAEDSLFWVVRPRIGAGGVSGIDTLLSGAFIGADAGEAKKTMRAFVGLETPPPITYGEQGKRFKLSTEDLGSLDIGSPVYYRQIKVGQVVSYRLADDGKGVDVEVFVRTPNDQYVTSDTRFWNASGVDVSVGANGLKVNTESLSTILAGGLAFIEPRYSPDAKPAREGDRFELFSDQESALAPPDGEAHYINMSFKQPLRGLVQNAPVEFLGVSIGRVVSVNLDYDPASKGFMSQVGAVIYPERLGKANEKLLSIMGAQGEEGAARLLQTFVKQGLRAQAKSSNLLTGQLYVSLSFITGAMPVDFDVAARPLRIPTVPGDLDKVQEQLQGIVEKVSKLPLDEIAGNLNRSLSELNRTLRQVNGELLPQVNDTLAGLSTSLDSVNAALAEDSPERQQLGQIVSEFQRTARSVRVLSDFLTRNPESLIRGRGIQRSVEAYEAPSSVPVLDQE
ncbi:MlaD family protein [Pseudomonas fulva]|uniref:PqiB family protein n=1 Tax=Pseudomonas fulva TaxID=47880 RepID=UPI00201DCA7E|nr:MlaD family protein [Pseudomonas fulva]UQY33037.1 MlaD family protein [Pseudomonas fulva]